MVYTKNPANDNNKDDSFNDPFGDSFFGSFGVKFNDDGSTSKVEIKEDVLEKPKKSNRTSSRTFVPKDDKNDEDIKSKNDEYKTLDNDKVDNNHISNITLNKVIHKSNDKNVRIENLNDFDDKIYIKNNNENTINISEKSNIFSTENDIKEFNNSNVKVEKIEDKNSNNLEPYRPSVFKSKIVDKEAKSKLVVKISANNINNKNILTNTSNTQNNVNTDNKDKKNSLSAESNKRGLDFAKTFANKKNDNVFRKDNRFIANTHNKDSRNNTNSFNNAFFKRNKGPKIKNAPTLKTRISGKSTIKKLELIKEESMDIRRRAPVVVIMGHVDHGKSTLLDYIRKTNNTENEVGGITQKMSSYEIEHNQHKITFLDTPGHEAFNAMRKRGASGADIAILIVSAEDGVKPQTLEALNAIKEANIPYFIGASKIDKTNADLDKTKQSLAENGIFVEGYGGDITIIPFSSKTGIGIENLLEMIELTTDVMELKASYDVPAECYIVEVNQDKIKGISACMIIKNGKINIGDTVVTGGIISKIRRIENHDGDNIETAYPGQPVLAYGFTDIPNVSDICIVAKNDEYAQIIANEQNEFKLLDEVIITNNTDNKKSSIDAIKALYGLTKKDIWVFPIVLKTDSKGTLDAVIHLLNKIKLNNIEIKVIRQSTGDINENDINLAQGSKDSIVIGYNTKVEPRANILANTFKTDIKTFDIIYKLTEYIEEEAIKRAPKNKVEETHGKLKILKVFNAVKTKQVLGGLVESGRLSVGDKVKILRRENEIGKGEVVGMQQARSEVKSVEEGYECGIMVEAKMEIAQGDHLLAYQIVEK